VTDRLLLDTHIVLWLDSGDDRLRASTRGLIDGCWQSGGTIFLSAVTVWEIALLVDAGRITSTFPLRPGSSASSIAPASKRCRWIAKRHHAAISYIILNTVIRLIDS